ncbi:MAG: MobF family relaxase [Pseudonocardiaceae bacterium]
MLSYYSGHSIDYLTGAVAAGRESYYTGAVAAGEPPGRWWGRGAGRLGLTGTVDHDVIAELYGRFIDPRDGQTVLGHTGRRYATAEELFARALEASPEASPEQREQLWLRADQEARSNVAFHDATFNVQKSVTVLHAAFEAQEVAARRAGDCAAEAAWAAHRVAVEQAIWAGNEASLSYLAEHAGYTRVGKHGGTAGRWADAHDWTVASFFQHDSRSHDPHLHIHNAILNRVEGPDGKWRTIDWEVAKRQKAAAGAVGERVMFGQLVATLGLKVAMRPDGKSREVLGVDARVMDLFSSRTHAITPKTAELVAAFEARFGHEPNALQLYRLSKQAVLATRPGKEHTGETTQDRLDRWDRMVGQIDEGLRSELAGGLAGVAWGALRLADRDQVAGEFDPEAVLGAAVAEVQSIRSRWTESDLIKAVSNHLPDYLGALSGQEVAQLVRGLAAQGIAGHGEKLTAAAPGAATLPDGERLANGFSAQQRPGSQLYASRDHARTERVLRAAAVKRGAVAVAAEVAEAFSSELAQWGTELGADQARAVAGVLSSGARVESLVGPAGTGKTLVVGALAKAWQDPGMWGGVRRRCFGLASAQIATDELTAQGLTARNVKRWLGAQQRLAQGRGSVEDQDLVLREGDLVVVDESSMANTPDLAAIRGHAHAAGAKLLLTGDHRQLAAVGAGGGMSMLAATGIVYELTEVRRFTHDWEKAASLRLREGDTDALLEYRTHGRIIDAGTFDQAAGRAVKGYLADYLQGCDTRLLVDTNDQAAQVCSQVRAELIALGEVQDSGVSLDKQGTTAGVGDLVEARRLAWELAGYQGNRRGPVTREQYRLAEVREDGSIVVDHITGRGPGGETYGDRLTLPAQYVATDLALGYASTVHSVQGLTVNTIHSVATSRTGRAALYVGLTRGRDRNTVYVQTLADAEDSRPGRTISRQDPIAVLDHSHADSGQDRAALAEAEASAAAMGSVQTAAERLAEISQRQAAGRTAVLLDQLLDRDVLSHAQRLALATDENTATLTRVLRQAEVAGHDPLDVLTAAVTERELGNARSIASVLHHRITDRVDLEPIGDSHTDWVPRVTDPAYQTHLTDLAVAADRRRDELGLQVAADQPQWAVEALGPVPADMHAHTQWVTRAGIVAAHRELTGHTAQDAALPGPPPRARVEEYASWRASWRALGRPDDVRAESELSDGALRVRVRAYQREQAWAPAYVARDLSATIQAAHAARDDAVLLSWRHRVTTDTTERTELQRQAATADERATALEKRAAALDTADTIRAHWYTRTALTRDFAERARLELASRGIDPDHSQVTVTAREWLAIHRADQSESERHHTVTDTVTDITLDEPATGQLTYVEDLGPGPVPETNVPDIREIASIEPPTVENLDNWERVPDAQQTAATIARAHRALLEDNARRAWETERENEDHALHTAHSQAERTDEPRQEQQPVLH